jgi:hypothetical protein
MSEVVDDRLIIAMLAGRVTVAAAAAAAGCSLRTAQRRLVDQQFKRRLETARRKVLDRQLESLAKALH